MKKSFFTPDEVTKFKKLYPVTMNTALRQVQRFLANDLMLNPDLVARARTITDACYQAYANTPRERIISYSKTEQIAIALDESGMLTQEAA